MATMLNHDHAFSTVNTPATAIMVSVATHCDTHAATVVVTMQFAAPRYAMFWLGYSEGWLDPVSGDPVGSKN
jgi:hypothetical protein